LLRFINGIILGGSISSFLAHTEEGDFIGTAFARHDLLPAEDSYLQAEPTGGFLPEKATNDATTMPHNDAALR
jgi:hypothetical protein